MRILSILVLIIFSLFLVAPKAYGQTESASDSGNMNEKIDSYVLFWPIVAGKTIDSPLYFLKDLKENIQEVFAFNNARKGEFQIVLSTKRLLETEKLVKENKNDDALKTLQKSKNSLDKAKEYLEEAKENDQAKYVQVQAEAKNKTENIEKYVKYLLTEDNSTTRPLLEEILKTSQALTNFLQ